MINILSVKKSCTNTFIENLFDICIKFLAGGYDRDTPGMSVTSFDLEIMIHRGDYNIRYSIQ